MSAVVPGSQAHTKLNLRASQVNLACDLGKPLFLHERKAHQPFVATLDSFKVCVRCQYKLLSAIPRHLLMQSRLPPVLVHCFTGTEEELEAYVSRGFYIGITGELAPAHC